MVLTPNENKISYPRARLNRSEDTLIILKCEPVLEGR